MKKSLRQQALAYRKQLSDDEIIALGQEITASISTLLQTLEPCTVGLFYPTQGEPDILDVLTQPALNAFDWALPVCCESPTGPLLRFAHYQADTPLEAGRYNIPVPAVKVWVQPQVVLIPSVAFHRNGTRLGYGAGWYDRTLSQLDPMPLKVGVAYASTEVQADFAEPHDKLLDCVLTEKEVILCSTRFNQ